MTTVADLVAETRSLIYSTALIEQNRLALTVNDTATTIQFSYGLRGITPGSRITIGEEMMHVWATTSGSNTATVERGYGGTTAATHVLGDLVEVNPPFPVHAIKDQLRKEIRSWPTDVFATGQVELDASAAYESQGIDLGVTGEWWHVLDVRHAPPAGTGSYLSGSWSSVRHFEVHRNAPVASFASGAALILNERVPGGTVSLTYSKPFDLSTWEDDTDLVTVCGLSQQMLDIPVMGAAWRLASFREVKRSLDEAQGESRFAQEVPPGTATQSAEYFRAIRNRRLGEEAARLVALYPRRHT